MPITITGVEAAQLTPAVSPLAELGSALHVLHDSGHHDAGDWAAGVRARMGARRWAQTRQWSWTVRAIRAAPFVTVHPPAEDFAAQLDRLRAMPPERLATDLIRPISRHGDPAVAIRYGRARGPQVAAVVEALTRRPAEAVAAFLAFLDDCWTGWFDAEWTRIRPVVAARTRDFTQSVAAAGPVRALLTLDPSVTVSTAGVSVAKVQNTRHDVARRGLVVVPSTLIRPHLYVADVPGRPLVLVHPTATAPAGTATPQPRELIRRLEAIAHPARLEVARAIATEPRTAGEIAALWRIDPTAVNRHLRVLADAGLALPVRRGRFVQYHLDAGAVAALGTDVVALLLR